MIPYRVVLENFLSFGTPAAEIVFAADEPLWVISGPNGVGKSAVFDAITYALFGCHRGGKGQGMSELIRHGSTTFRVEFEFGFAGREYRVVRNFGKKAVEKVFRRDAGEWAEVDIGTGKLGVRQWAERELGLTFEQFTASVLLRQGEADRIITAGGKERIELLKQVIGLDRYEQLSQQVRDGTRRKDATRKAVADRLAAVPVVTDDERVTARGEVDRTASALVTARTDETAAEKRVDQAGRYADLTRDRDDLDRRLAEADARKAAATDIRTRNERLRSLTDAVPKLADLVAARRIVADLGPDLDRLRRTVADTRDRRGRLTTNLEAARTAADEARRSAEELAGTAKDVRRDLDVTVKDLTLAEEIERVDADLAGFSPDLDQQSASAAADLTAARDAAADAEKTEAAAAALLKHGERDLAAFASVEVGATCSRCRQPVDAEHAATELADLTAEVQRRRDDADAASASVAAARERLAAAMTGHEFTADQTARRDKIAAHRLGLTRGGIPPTVAATRQRSADLEVELTRLGAAVDDDQAKHRAAADTAKRLAADLQAADAELADLGSQLDDKSPRFARAEATAAALAGAVPGDWPDALTEADVDELRAEQAALETSGVAADARKLDEDRVRRDEWEQARGRIVDDMAAVPEAARVPVSTAEHALTSARIVAADAEYARDTTRRNLDALDRYAALRAELLAEDRTAEAAARVHARLDGLLGRDGLQRDLVRSAECQIVAFADETVRHLSDGDLSIELEDADDGRDKAFTLRVRRADAPEAIGVAYLSGSQKFRVAVAVALGIGRFAAAAAGTRPLESVIIDEGFGSLDRDGLRCMADELARLKDRCALKRIVLVSHQEEFVDRFPVGWRLSRGETGTTALAYRRQ